VSDIGDDLERQRQKQYDQATLGFYSYIAKEVTQLITNPIYSATQQSKYLKLTTGFLNSRIIVLQLQNMAELSSLTIQFI
jgi:hypothetical protein